MYIQSINKEVTKNLGGSLHKSTTCMRVLYKMQIKASNIVKEK